MIRELLGGGLTKRVGKAGIWTVAEFGGNSGLRLVSNLILTRLLSPEVFGLMALAQVFLNGMTMLSDVGVRASVIRSPRGEDPVFLQTAWTVQIIRGAIVAGLACLIAWPVAQAYEQPLLFPLICTLSLASLIQGGMSISVARVSRKLMLKRLTLMMLLSQVLTLVVTVSLAWSLRSVWALAIGACIGAALQVVLSHVMLPRFDHKLRLEAETLQEIIWFGRWILLATFFTFLGGRGQQAIFSLFIPVEVIGLLAIATLLAAVPSQLVSKLLNTVLLPSLSELRRERPEALANALRKTRLFIISLAFPIFFGVAFAAQPIVDFLYDDRYQAAGLILTFSALNGAVPLLSNSYQNLLLAEGRSDIHAGLMFLWAGTTIAGIITGFWALGLVGSFVGIALAASVMFFINLVIARRRGYATSGLDLLAFAIIVLVYGAALWGLDIPPVFLSPELAGNIMG